jgi:hypothetical protein
MRNRDHFSPAGHRRASLVDAVINHAPTDRLFDQDDAHGGPVLLPDQNKNAGDQRHNVEKENEWPEI